MKRILKGLVLTVLMGMGGLTLMAVSQTPVSIVGGQVVAIQPTPTNTPAVPTWTPAATAIATIVSTVGTGSPLNIVQWPVTFTTTGAQTFVCPPGFYPGIQSLAVTETSAGPTTYSYTLRSFPQGTDPTLVTNPTVLFGGNTVTISGGSGHGGQDVNLFAPGGSNSPFPVPWNYWYLNMGTLSASQTLRGLLIFEGR
jgi:hypothetical protein